jgi:hypothetical protein
MFHVSSSGIHPGLKKTLQAMGGDGFCFADQNIKLMFMKAFS